MDRAGQGEGPEQGGRHGVQPDGRTYEARLGVGGDDQSGRQEGEGGHDLYIRNFDW